MPTAETGAFLPIPAVCARRSAPSRCSRGAGPLRAGAHRAPHQPGCTVVIHVGGAAGPLAFSASLGYQMTMARETIDQLARRLAESLPQGVKSVREDLEQNFRTILSSGLSRLELVTREEFEVQEAVLGRTRQKLEALESRLDELESARAEKAAKKASAKPAKKKTRKKAAKKVAEKKKKPAQDKAET